MNVGDRATLKVPDRLKDGHSLEHMEGERHEVTILATDRTLDSHPAALVQMTSWAGVVTVELTADQKRGLGLPEDGRYSVCGGVEDGEGQPVSLPRTEEIVVPKRWLTALP